MSDRVNTIPWKHYQHIPEPGVFNLVVGQTAYIGPKQGIVITFCRERPDGEIDTETHDCPDLPAVIRVLKTYDPMRGLHLTPHERRVSMVSYQQRLPRFIAQAKEHAAAIAAWREKHP